MSQHALEERQKMNYPERTFDNSADIVSNSNKHKPKMYVDLNKYFNVLI